MSACERGSSIPALRMLDRALNEEPGEKNMKRQGMTGSLNIWSIWQTHSNQGKHLSLSSHLWSCMLILQHQVTYFKRSIVEDWCTPGTQQWFEVYKANVCPVNTCIAALMIAFILCAARPRPFAAILWHSRLNFSSISVSRGKSMHLQPARPHQWTLT